MNYEKSEIINDLTPVVPRSGAENKGEGDNYELLVKLGRIGKLAGSGDALERDLALDLLREVYAEIKFGDDRRPVEEGFKAAEPVPAAEPVDEPALEGEDCGAPEIEEPVAAANNAEPASPVIPRPVAPDVIRSLYGSETESEPEYETAPETEPQPSPETEPLPSPKTEPAPAPDEKPRATLGDVVAAGHRTLGETLRKSEPDMSTHAAAAERSGLKRSIGLNDRFLVIRDMFDGDAAAFDAAIDRLDGFTDLDEAVIWLRDNFDRSADNPGMQLLVALVERKLGR